MKKPKKQDVSFFMGHGAVAASISSIIGLGIYGLQDMKKPGKVDSDVDEKQINKKSPLVSIYFTKESDIIREIKRLQRLRRMMRKTWKVPVKLAKKTGPKCGAI